MCAANRLQIVKNHLSEGGSFREVKNNIEMKFQTYFGVNLIYIPKYVSTNYDLFLFLKKQKPKQGYRFTLDIESEGLTEEQRDFYEENGFIVFRKIVPDDALDRYAYFTLIN